MDLQRYFLSRLRLQNHSKMRSHFSTSQAPIGAFFENLGVLGHKCPAHRHRVATHRRTPLGILQPVSRFWFSRTSTLGGRKCRQGLQQVAFTVLRPKTQSASVLSSLHRLLTRLCKRVTTALPCTVVLPCHLSHRLPLQLEAVLWPWPSRATVSGVSPRTPLSLAFGSRLLRLADFYSNPAPGHQLASVSRRNHLAVSLTAYG